MGQALGLLVVGDKDQEKKDHRAAAVEVMVQELAAGVATTLKRGTRPERRIHSSIS